MTATFATGGDLGGFRCHKGQRPELIIGTDNGGDAETMGQVLATLKAQDLYHMALPAVGQDAKDTAHLVVLKSGEVCRVDVIELAETEALARHDTLLTAIRKDLTNIVAHLAPFMPGSMTTAQIVVEDETAIHTLIPYNKNLAQQRATVDGFFAREGLQIDHAQSEPFMPGWSVSALACINPTEIGLFGGVVMRLQCVWYQQRGQRDFCIAQASLLARRATVETDIITSHEVIRRLFDFTLWEHELREFSANLKPWLKTAFDSLYAFWDMAEESAYVEKTLKQSHELLASGYQSRILIQERQQSRLLFVIAAVGLLGVAGSLMSIWTALTWGGIVTQGYWTSDSGSAILVGMIMANFIGLSIVLYRFVWTQIK